MEHTTIAVDLARSVFQVAISHRVGRIDAERRLTRDRFVAFFAQQPPATVVFEACGSAHYWARQLQPLGHTVRLLPAHDVRRYVRRNKTDRTDTKGMLEANRNEEIHAVPVKTLEQQAIASLHRLRSTWLATRTARLNTLRGLLREFGVFIPVGAHHVVPRLRELLGEPTDRVPRAVQGTLAAACAELDGLETHMHDVERQPAALARQLPDVTLLQTIPGVGVLTATALVALVGDIRRVRSGRHFASFLGLTPKEDSSGGRRRLGAISKQGDVYVRMLLTHGARSLVWHAKAAGQPTALQPVGRGHRTAAWAQRGGRGRRQQTRADRVGRVGAATPIRNRAAARVVTDSTVAHLADCTERTHHGAPVGPARGYADNSAGREGPCKRGVTPITRLAVRGRASDWHPARGYP
jgi:transposase